MSMAVEMTRRSRGLDRHEPKLTASTSPSASSLQQKGKTMSPSEPPPPKPTTKTPKRGRPRTDQTILALNRAVMAVRDVGQADREQFLELTKLWTSRLEERYVTPFVSLVTAIQKVSPAERAKILSAVAVWTKES